MIYIRSILFQVIFYTWTLLVSVLGLPVLLFPPMATIYIGKIWAGGTLLILWFICGIRYRVEGGGFITDSPLIIASKHQSAWETILFYLLCKRPCFVLKRELRNIPLFGWYIMSARSIALDRGKGVSALKRLIAQAKERLAEGRQIVIFPEGTRVRVGEKKPLQPGIAAIYEKAGVPVVPMALNSGMFWPRNSLLKKPGMITVKFLPPIPPGLNRREFIPRLERDIQETSERLVEESM